jgi:putative hydrolase of the HAD superfamily
MNKRRETVFFDAGGVLLDETENERLRAEIIVEILEKKKSGYTKEKYWNDVERAVHLYVSNVYNYILWRKIREEKEYKAALREMEKEWKERKPKIKLMRNIDKVIPLIAENYRIGILGQYNYELKLELQQKNLLQYFTYQDTQEEFRITKPDPRYFESVLSKAGVEAVNSIMVGDRIDKDIIPAKMIGMKTVRIRTGIHKDQKPRQYEEIPDYEIDDIMELLEILK